MVTTNTNAALRNALIEAQAGLEFAAARLPQTTDFVPSHIAALKIVNAALTTAAAVPAAGMVTVPEVPDERMERAIAGAFCGTVYEAREAWAAGIAAAPKAAPQPAVQQGDDLQTFAIVDSNYAAGMLLGWNLCTAGMDAEFSRIREDRMRAAVQASRAAHPAAPVAQGDADFEAVRKKLCALQRYSFVLDYDGVVRRVQDRTGKWIEFDDAHELFDPVAVDAAIAAQAKEGA